MVSSTGRRATTRATTRASATIANTTTAAAIARATAQQKWTAVGCENAGRSNGLSAHALVLSPVHAPMPMNTSEPRPAAIRPGRSTTGSRGPSQPCRLDQDHRPDHR